MGLSKRLEVVFEKQIWGGRTCIGRGVSWRELQGGWKGIRRRSWGTLNSNAFQICSQSRDLIEM
jgi:hypothetical protein